MKTILTLLLIVNFQITFAQTDYFKKGNELLQQGKYKEAQNVFENGLKESPENLMFKNQIALTLINQDKNNEAEKIIEEVLNIDSLNVASLWYGGINNFKSKESNLRKAINYFEKSYPLIDQNSSQFFAVNFYIGRSYKNLLLTEGLSIQETDRMLEAYKKYTNLQPNADDYQETITFIKYIEEKRPPKNVEKWKLTISPEDAGTFSMVKTNTSDVRIPGKWTKLNTMDDSGQTYLQNSDKVIIAIAQNPKNAYPFFKNEKDNYKNVEEFYKWDSDYRKKLKFKTNKIKENPESEYIIWKYNDGKLDNIFLFGSVKENFINLLIYTSNWNEDEKIDFLEKIYKLNK